MARFDFNARRLFVRSPLSAGARIDIDRTQINYLVNVLRKGDGDEILVFNGRDGEWQASLVSEGRKRWRLEARARVRPQPRASGLRCLFAPLRQARQDYMIEKAVELGVARLTPVLTQHGQVTRVNRGRVEANAIEAAEQCGILTIPTIDEPVALSTLIDGWAVEERGRRIVYCDEGATHADPLAVLSAFEPSPLALLVGPEGGFSAEEQDILRAQPFVTALPLGPRILRADTAAVAALALVQAVLGDWKSGPPER